MQRWPETKRLLGLLVNSSGGAHAATRARLVRAARKQDRRLAAALLAAAVPHTAEAGRGRQRRARRGCRASPPRCARELLRNFPKGRRGQAPSAPQAGGGAAAPRRGVLVGANNGAVLDDDLELEVEASTPKAKGDRGHADALAPFASPPAGRRRPGNPVAPQPLAPPAPGQAEPGSRGHRDRVETPQPRSRRLESRRPSRPQPPSPASRRVPRRPASRPRRRRRARPQAEATPASSRRRRKPAPAEAVAAESPLRPPTTRPRRRGLPQAGRESTGRGRGRRDRFT